MTTAPPGYRPPAPAFTPARLRVPRIPVGPHAPNPAWPGLWPLATHLELAAIPESAATARGHARAVLREWHVSDAAIGDAASIVTELLSNAVTTTRLHRLPDPVRLWLLGNGTSALILVWDATAPAPAPRDAASAAEHGRGLLLVAALSRVWGHYHVSGHPGGKAVWAVIDFQPRPGPRPPA